MIATLFLSVVLALDLMAVAWLRGARGGNYTSNLIWQSACDFYVYFLRVGCDDVMCDG